MAKFSKEVTVESLFCNEVAPEKMVLQGMKDLEAALKSNFQESQSFRQRQETLFRGVHKQLLDRPGAANERMIQELQQMEAEFLKRKPEKPIMDKMQERIFSGSIGATRVPPFNYQWTWSNQSNSPSLSVNANAASGQMNFYVANAGRNASGTAMAALGIYFRPVVRNGILRLWAHPAFSYYWWTICAFASAHSDAFIGLYVGRYNLSGGFDGAPVNQQISLWNDSSWWSGVGSRSGSNSAYPLFAQFNVDSSHWYALWVWIGGNASGAGWGTFSGSGAGSSLNVALPSISWELF
jgi:hypothetical protein